MAMATAITIGNFDGVHLGHQRLLTRSRQAVGQAGRVIAITFDPHPATVLQPGRAIHRLSSVSQRVAWMKQSGADEVMVIATGIDLLRLTPEQFLARYVQPHQASAVVEGPDFRFGHQRSGSIDTIRNFGQSSGWQTIVVESVELALSDQSIVLVSSSLVRWLLERGRVRDAALLLGRPYEIQGTVVRGDQRGRTIGFPTMNLNHGDFVLPADGVYAGDATLPDGQTFAAAISVGAKPTFGDSPRVCEAYLPDYAGPLDDYGFSLQLRFTRWLRDQLKYESVKELIAQLERDVISVRHLHPAPEAHMSRLPARALQIGGIAL